jgi:hypothetical protein
MRAAEDTLIHRGNVSTASALSLEVGVPGASAGLAALGYNSKSVSAGEYYCFDLPATNCHKTSLTLIQ